MARLLVLLIPFLLRFFDFCEGVLWRQCRALVFIVVPRPSVHFVWIESWSGWLD